jgi:hypothetical protein
MPMILGTCRCIWWISILGVHFLYVLSEMNKIVLYLLSCWFPWFARCVINKLSYMYSMALIDGKLCYMLSFKGSICNPKDISTLVKVLFASSVYTSRWLASYSKGASNRSRILKPSRASWFLFVYIHFSTPILHPDLYFHTNICPLQV